MNIKNILKEIEQVDSSAFDEVSGRRQLLKSFGAKVAAIAFPLAAGSAFNKASAKTTSGNFVADSLNFMLEICYFEYNFYHTANNTGGLIPAGDLPGFQAIESQEKLHISFLSTTVSNVGGTPFTPKFYDPTTANPLFIPAAYNFESTFFSPIFANVFNDYASFLIAAQCFEDIGVHAYKGQVSAAMVNAPLLADIMGLQCAEARHAAHVRLVRRFNNAPENPAPWITNNIPANGDPKLQLFYNGEDNLLQNGIDVSALPGLTGTVPVISATAGFDEMLSDSIVTGFISPFLN
jgi:ferritin-like protein